MLAYSTAPLVAQDTEALAVVWRNLTAESCPSSYNFHLHTLYSDGRLTPVALMEQACAIGLKGLAITDHHSVQGFYLAWSYLEKLRSQNPAASFPYLWTGIEITALLDGVEVHLLGYGFAPSHPSLTPYLTGERPSPETVQAEQVINALHEAGALVVLAHPFRYTRHARELVPEAIALGVDGLEAYYAYGNPKPWCPSWPETLEVLDFCHTHHLLPTCGTDSHGLDLLVRI